MQHVPESRASYCSMCLRVVPLIAGCCYAGRLPHAHSPVSNDCSGALWEPLTLQILRTASSEPLISRLPSALHEAALTGALEAPLPGPSPSVPVCFRRCTKLGLVARGLESPRLAGPCSRSTSSRYMRALLV